MHVAVSDGRQRLDREIDQLQEAASGTLAIGSWPRKRTSAKVPLSAMKTSAALAKKTGQETVIDRWYRSVQNPLFNPRVMISRLPILTMLDKGFFEF